MTTTALEAQPDGPVGRWHLSFFMSFDEDGLQPFYCDVHIARQHIKNGESDWSHDGIATFEGPAVIVPRAGQELIPYMLYHLDEIKSYLMEEHVRLTFNGTAPTISQMVGMPPVVAPVPPLD